MYGLLQVTRSSHMAEAAQCSIACLLDSLLHLVVLEGLWSEAPSATSSCCAVNTSKLPLLLTRSVLGWDTALPCKR